MTKITDILDKNYGNLRYELPEFSLDLEKFQKKKILEKIKTHIPYEIRFPKLLRLYDIITTNKNKRGQRNYYLHISPYTRDLHAGELRQIRCHTVCTILIVHCFIHVTKSVWPSSGNINI